ncbi:hypothetical protein [Microbacterium sp. No. 7]|uniref:hypothetical protein n=1 Tax=Microbacterium sp. No. 7 TaxID=1714373 RepID=UPI0006D1CB9E|nr:hypothetical protein [Microbacterium sp. No. 7]ALJ20321.1 hypothetical protein AOA12_10520 [Microbacterium sp. No. 7]
MSTITCHTTPEAARTGLFVEAPWTSARDTRSVAHQLLESSKNLFTLLPPGPRAGTILIRCTSSADAHDIADFLAAPAEYTLTTTPAEAGGRFVVTGGQITITQELTGSWAVRAPWKEVLE